MNSNSYYHNVALYSIVFTSRTVRFGVAALFCALLIQPVAYAYAAEEVAGTDAQSVDSPATGPSTEPEIEITAEEPESSDSDAADPKPVTDESVPDAHEDVAAAVESDLDNESESKSTSSPATDTERSVEVVGEIKGSSTETIAVDGVAEAEPMSDANEGEADSATNTPVVPITVPLTPPTPDVSSSDASTSPVSGTSNSTSTIATATTGSIGMSTTSNATASNTRDTSTETPTTSPPTEPVESTESNEDSTESENTQQPQSGDSDSDENQTDDTTDSSPDEDAALDESRTDSGTTLRAESSSVTTALNRYQFAESECVSVGDGSYYCSTTQGIDTAPPETITYAASPDGADTEIFFVTNKETIQITDNDFDDTSPHYDPFSESLVWHRLVDGRYQIMQYDIKTKEEVQLTTGSVNNMKPTSERGVVVWQRWYDTNWEIVMSDNRGDLIRLTNSDSHDIAPDVQDGYVVWHTSAGSGERAVGIFEIASGMISYIADSENGQVMNPRFVLVYDMEFSNGDVVTKGFDPASGEVIPLHSQPASIPTHIPEPEPTGDTAALINTKSTSTREDFAEDGVAPTTATKSTSTKSALGTASTTQTVASSTHSLPDNFASSTIDMVPEAATTTMSLTEFDLIVEPFATSSATSTQTTDGTQ